MKISSRLVFDSATSSLKPATLEIDGEGKIESIEWDSLDGEVSDGIICPGFINTHCHLELSHLKGKVREHTGMAGFISDLIPQRDKFSEEEILEAMKLADQEMYRNGIVAVGDISNSVESCKLKVESSLYYHTFVELFDLNPSQTEDAFQKGLEVLKSFGNLPASLVPHAPYTVTPGLFKKISDWYVGKDLPACIHHQESRAENDFFSRKGPIWELLAKMNMDLDWVPKYKDSLEYITGYFNVPKLQLVHNTVLSNTGGRWPLAGYYLCSCPAANLFIENRLPDYNSWIKSGSKITVGTDSLASNHNLSILEELKIIQKACPEIPTSALLQWATKNGADFLGIRGMYGSLEVGKRPGILQILKTDRSGNLLPESIVERLI